jgi:hypothetical protein
MGRRRARPTKRSPTQPSAPRERRPAPGSPPPARLTKAQRLDARRQAQRRRSLRNRVIIGVLVVAVAAGIIVKTISGRRAGQRLVDQLTAGSCDFDRRSDSGSTHVAAPSFRIDPPSGGDHLASVARPGVYSEGNAPVDGELVHALEHGYIILWHRPDAAADTQQALRDLRTEFERDVLIVARPTLSAPVAATAWHKRLLCQDLERDVLARFVTEYRNDGPEKVPH